MNSIFDELHGYLKKNNPDFLDCGDDLIYNPYYRIPKIETEFIHGLDEHERIRNSHNIATFLSSYFEDIINRFFRVSSLPLFENVMLSTVNKCNGTCSFCAASAQQDKRHLKIMSDHIFDKIIDELSTIDYSGRITMQGLNDPFVDPQIVSRIIKIATKIPNARIHITTNGILLTSEKMEIILPVLHKMRINNYNNALEINFSILEILNNFKENAEFKKKVKITLRKPNEIMSFFGKNKCNRTIGEIMDCSCLIPFNTISILPDGKLNLCMSDINEEFTVGDILENSLREIWYNEKYYFWRNAIANGRKDCNLCKYCDMFCF